MYSMLCCIFCSHDNKWWPFFYLIFDSVSYFGNTLYICSIHVCFNISRSSLIILILVVVVFFGCIDGWIVIIIVGGTTPHNRLIGYSEFHAVCGISIEIGIQSNNYKFFACWCYVVHLWIIVYCIELNISSKKLVICLNYQQ